MKKLILSIVAALFCTASFAQWSLTDISDSSNGINAHSEFKFMHTTGCFTYYSDSELLKLSISDGRFEKSTFANMVSIEIYNVDKTIKSKFTTLYELNDASNELTINCSAIALQVISALENGLPVRFIVSKSSNAYFDMTVLPSRYNSNHINVWNVRDEVTYEYHYTHYLYVDSTGAYYKVSKNLTNNTTVLYTNIIDYKNSVIPKSNLSFLSYKHFAFPYKVKCELADYPVKGSFYSKLLYTNLIDDNFDKFFFSNFDIDWLQSGDVVIEVETTDGIKIMNVPKINI